jgi:hypothetical protein
LSSGAPFVSYRLAAGRRHVLHVFDMTSGNLGVFKWIETVSKDDTGFIDAIRTLRRHLIGLRAVNTSWDSGLLIPSDEERRQGWTIEQGRAVSPVIDDRVIDAWPWCDGGWEEWYFFSTLPSDLNLSAYCNWGGLSIGDWASLVDTTNGFNLQQQLETAQPTVVLGEGQRLFAISPNVELIDDFRRHLQEA